MKRDFLLDSFEKMQLNSELAFEIKGGALLASQCQTATSFLDTSGTIDYTDGSSVETKDRTSWGSALDVIAFWK